MAKFSLYSFDRSNFCYYFEIYSSIDIHSIASLLLNIKWLNSFAKKLLLFPRKEINEAWKLTFRLIKTIHVRGKNKKTWSNRDLIRFKLLIIFHIWSATSVTAIRLFKGEIWTKQDFEDVLYLAATRNINFTAGRVFDKLVGVIRESKMAHGSKADVLFPSNDHLSLSLSRKLFNERNRDAD